MPDPIRDRVVLVVDEDNDADGGLHVEAFDIDIGVFETPCRFAISVGGQDIKALRRKYRPNRDFALVVEPETGGIPYTLFSGKTDSRGVEGGASGNTRFSIRGRDHLAQLGNQAPRDQSYKGTYEQIVRQAIIDCFSGKYSGAVELDKLEEPPVTELVVDSPNGWATKTPRHPAGIRAGSTYLCMLKNLLCKTPLVLGWDPNARVYKLYEPRAEGEPIGDIVCTDTESNILTFSEDFDITGRACSVVCYGRSSGKKEGFQLSSFDVRDDELFSLGVRRRLVQVDQRTADPEEARFHALRNLAAARRDGASLLYTVPGLTTKGSRPWVPNSLVRVTHDELELKNEIFYLESVSMVGNTTTTHTTLKLTRPKDLETLMFRDGTS